MAIMETTHYNPTEVLKTSNYLEVAQCSQRIRSVLEYALTVHAAIEAYTSNIEAAINVSYIELDNCIAELRDILSILGTAANPCYDIIVELRELLANMQTLTFSKIRFGSLYIAGTTVREV